MTPKAIEGGEGEVIVQFPTRGGWKKGGGGYVDKNRP